MEKIKSGSETLKMEKNPSKITLLDFWRWSTSDILSNATRGVFAEFLVATAIGKYLNQIRNEWDSYDLETSDGIKIEVKSAAYLQNWYQKRHSIISFNIKPTHAWDNATNVYATTAKRQADVYVFCLLKHKDKQTIDPLNLDQWDFYVLSSCVLDDLYGNQKSIGLNAITRNVKGVTYIELATEIKRVYNLIKQ